MLFVNACFHALLAFIGHLQPIDFIITAIIVILCLYQ